MNVKCTSTTVTVFPPSGGNYPRSVAEYITKGNVYEVDGSFHDQYFRIQHDHGDGWSEMPTYLFEATDEPVTVNPNRQKEIEDAAEKQRELIADQQESLRRQQIADEMDRFYDPDGFRRTQQQRARRRSAISNRFVGGLPYDNY